MSSSASKGADRERFVSKFLQRVLPPNFRFGSGEVIDAFDGISGQIDILIEFPFFPSVAGHDDDGSRLYPCEGVAAAIEVKSDIEHEWKDFESTLGKLNSLRTAAGPVLTNSRLGMTERVAALFAVGFTGWKTVSPLRDRVGRGKASAILVIDKGIFCARPEYRCPEIDADPARALWLFACCVFSMARSIKDVGGDPRIYAIDDPPS